DAVAQVADDGEVVGDHEVRHPQLFTKPPKERDDLESRGGIEGRRRLVENEEAGLRRECPCDRHALRLAAAELVAVARQEVLAETDAVEQTLRFGPDLRSR